MQSPLKLTMDNVPDLRRLGAQGWLPLLFAVWLLLAVLTPEAVYRTFFHVLIYPLTLYLIVRKDGMAVWQDPFVRLFLLLCGYMAVTTWLVGSDPADDDVQAMRWAFEAALGILAYFLWMRAVVCRAGFWARWLLLVALAGALSGLLFSLQEAFQGGRIQGFGAMGHPIQGASIATIFLATGLFLTFRENSSPGRIDIVLAIASVVSVCAFVTLSQSRAPVIALLFYLVFLAFFLGYRYRRPATILALLLVTVCVVVLLQWFIGLGVLSDQMISRGLSYRFEIWAAYLTYPPESVFLGNGAGLDFRLTDAAKLHLKPMGLEIAHPHNIWLGVFVDNGLIGVLMQAGLVILPAVAVSRSRLALRGKLHLLAILVLFLLLTFTDEYTLVTSLHPIWFVGWIPLVFVWVWSRYRTGENGSAIADSTHQGER